MSCNKATEITEQPNIYENNIKEDYELFENANQELRENNFEEAISEFDKIQIYFPNSIYSAKARLIVSYINFINGEYEKTKASTENFIKYYPGNEDIVYAYYLNAMTDYVLIKKPGYDQKNTKETKKKLIFINNAFPSNKYQQDIILKLNIVNNTLAEQLLNIGKYYEEKNDYAIALNYYLEIFKDFQDTLVIEETLYLIIKNYLILDEKVIATKYASILGYNYSDSKWYKKSYNLIKGINKEIEKNYKWYEKLNPVKLIKREKITKEKKWFEPMKPKFKIF
jgi:outer membrane protein assembly factor BamD